MLKDSLIGGNEITSNTVIDLVLLGHTADFWSGGRRSNNGRCSRIGRTEKVDSG